MASSTTTTPKRLIVLCDGTWQNSVSGEAYSYPTNVTRFSRALSQFGERDGQKVPQILYYQPGVGTGALADKIAGGIYGAGLSACVRAAYGFLAHNYNPGDQIYFFGYSRGAYTARAIAGLVTSLGLLTKKGMDRFGAVYQEYYQHQSQSQGGHPEQPNIARLEELSGGELHPGAKDSVEIVGVWDTVGFHDPKPILGNNDTGEQFEFYNTALSIRVNYGFHALSLDETREAFLPTLWDSEIGVHGGNGTNTVKQVWFSGTHAIGGGDQDSTLADIALGWMVSECSSTKTLSFVDVDESDRMAYLLLDTTTSTSTAGGAADTPWATATYPDTQAGTETAGGGASGLLSNLKKRATDAFWTVTNWVLPPKSGIRTPNAAGLDPARTNERLHQSIRDRNLDRWPCRPVKGRVPGRTRTRWELAHKPGAVLDESVPGDVELMLKGRIRPVG
ncbi:hypothetical protein ABEF95_014396 [Exophiala dermatitidis]